MKRNIITFGLLAIALLSVAGAAYAGAGCDPNSGLQGGVSCTAQGQGFASGTLQANIQNVVNVLLLAVGIISVIMVIVGGIRYALSGGDENNTKAAKNTITYAIVGLVISILAFAIVNFVTAIFKV